MSETRFTPGPLKVRCTEIGTDQVVEDARGTIIGVFMGCDEHDNAWLPDAEEAEANARLFVAASRMYEALTDILDFLGHTGYDTRIVKGILAEIDGKE